MREDTDCNLTDVLLCPDWIHLHYLKVQCVGLMGQGAICKMYF